MNYTLTNYPEHTEKFSHDMANCYLAGDEIRPRLVWENVQSQVVQTAYGFLIFDDTVLDKNFSRHIELVRRQYSAAGKRRREPPQAGQPDAWWNQQVRVSVVDG